MLTQISYNCQVIWQMQSYTGTAWLLGLSVSWLNASIYHVFIVWLLNRIEWVMSCKAKWQGCSNTDDDTEQRTRAAVIIWFILWSDSCLVVHHVSLSLFGWYCQRDKRCVSAFFQCTIAHKFWVNERLNACDVQEKYTSEYILTSLRIGITLLSEIKSNIQQLFTGPW